MAEIDASKIDSRFDVSKMEDPSKYDFIPTEGGKYLPVPKASLTKSLAKLGLNLASKAINAPLNDVQQQLDIPETTMGGDIEKSLQRVGDYGRAAKYGLSSLTATSPEEGALREKQVDVSLSGGNPDEVGKFPVVSNAGKDAPMGARADASAPPSEQPTQNTTPQNHEAERKALLKSMGYDVDSPAFKTMEENFNNYKKEQLDAADLESSVFLQTRDKIARAEADQAVKAANYNMQTQNSIRDYKTLNDKFIDMTLNMPNRQETENNYWANKSNKSRVFGLLSLGFGNAQTWANYNNVIDSELNAQVNKMKLFDKGLTNQQTLVGMNRDIAKDENDAFLMAKNTMLQLSEMVLKSIAVKKGTREALFNTEKDIDKLRYEREQIQQALMLSTKQKFLNQQAEQQSIEPETPIMQVPADRRERFVPDFGEAFGDKETVKKFRGTAGELLPAFEMLQNLKKISDLPVSQRANSFNKISAETGVTRGMLTGALKTIVTGTGTFSDSDREIVEELIGDPTKVDILKLESKKLDTLLELVRKNLNTQAVLAGVDTTYKNRWKINRQTKSYAPNAVKNE